MTTSLLSNDTATLSRRSPTPARGEELDDFRRYYYADGWDDDDAALGWVDEEIVRATPRRRMH